MIRSFSFTVPGEPLPWERATPTLRRDGKVGARKPRDTKAYQHKIAAYALQSRPRGWRTDWAAYAVRIDVYRRGTAGDWDNLGKQPGDSLQSPPHRPGIRVPGILWDNDSQIKDGHVVIHEGVDPKDERMVIAVEMIGDETVAEARATRRKQ